MSDIAYSMDRPCRVCDPKDKIIADLLYALEELHATVRGECPSLLESDSGGSDALAIQIEAAIAAAKVGQ